MLDNRHRLHGVLLLLAAGLTTMGCNCGGGADSDAGEDERDAGAAFDAGPVQADAGRDAGVSLDAGTQQRDAGQSPTGTVTRFRPSVLGRQGHAMVELADGTVLVTGSIRSPPPNTGRPEAELFDLDAGTVAVVGPMQDGRHNHQLTLLADGRVLVTGGSGGSPPAAWRTAELYNPSTRSFSRVAGELAVARVAHAAFRLSSGALAGQVLLIGGGPLGAAMTVELYEPSTSTFSAVTTIGAPPERQGAAVALLDDESVLVTSGRVLAGGAPVGESYVYQPSSATFRQVADAGTARNSPTATRLLDGRVLVVGGSTDANSLGPAVASSELFDPATGTFTAGPALATPRRSHTASLLGSGRVVVGGGTTGSMTLGSTELFVPASSGFAPGGDLVGARALLKSLSLSDGRVFVNGGQYMSGLILGTAEVISD